jgi:hypothetical protein
MTAAGIAFIAGGIATLICLRSVLFGRAKQPEGRGEQPEARGRQRAGRGKQSQGRPKPPEGRGPRGKRPEGRGTQRERERPAAERPRRSPSGERTRTAGRPPPDFSGLTDMALTATADLDLPTARRAAPQEWPLTPRQTRRHGDLSGGLASIGLADEEIDHAGYVPGVETHPTPADEEIGSSHDDDLVEVVAEEPAPTHRVAPAEPETEPLVTPGDEESRPIPVRRVDRSDRAYGDRVAGWVRPEYHDDPVGPPSGEYWTPVPLEGLGLDLPEDDPEPSARGYGWPTPVERLPAVPDYEPATGFDLAPVATEPTELVPTWPPLPDDRRIQLPRTWASRDAKPSGNRFLENEPRRPAPDDAGQRFRAPTGEPERRRPRPRPRPANPDNVYVSRHAADPPH